MARLLAGELLYYCLKLHYYIIYYYTNPVLIKTLFVCPQTQIRYTRQSSLQNTYKRKMAEYRVSEKEAIEKDENNADKATLLKDTPEFK